MNNVFVRNITRFISLILIQVLVLNNMNLSGYLIPYIYILFILLLPVNINRSFLLILAFLTGLTIDYFGNTLGLHASACVAIAFLRPGVIKLLFRNQEFAANEEPTQYSIGFRGFIKYSIILVFIHQFILFYLEVFSFDLFFTTFLKIILSSTLSIIIMLIAVLIFGKRKKRI